MRIITPEFNLIKIGYQGENEAVCVQFDVSNWPGLYGEGGSFSLRHQRAGDPDGYPVIVTEEDGTVSWVVSNIDTRDPGYGKATLIYKVNDVIAMSVEYSTLTEASVGENPEPPEPWKPWIDEILEARNEAVAAAEDAEADARSASDSANDASTDALKAEGYAVGTQDGEPVGPDSPYYQKNAKYYYEEIADEMGPVQAHLADHNNPHQVTAAQVGAIEKVAGAVANDLAMLTADGNLSDSGISADYLVPVKAKSGSVIEFNSDGAVPLKSVVLKGKTEVVNQSLVNNNATYQLTGKNLLDASTLALRDVTGGGVMRYAFAPILLPAGTYILSKAAGTNQCYLTNITAGYTATSITAWPFSFTLTEPNTVMVRTALESGSEGQYNLSNVQLEKGATATTYEPYHDGGSIVADSLNGIGTVADEQDEQGNITRRFDTVDLGTLSWEQYDGTIKRSADLQYLKAAGRVNLVSDTYTPENVQSVASLSMNCICGDNSNGRIYVNTSEVTPSGNIVYELRTPTTDTTTPASLTTQKGYNILRTVSGDIQNAPADIEYFNGLAAVIVEALQ